MQIAIKPVQQGGPSRCCPQCDSLTPLLKGERLWPFDWRCAACGYGLSYSDGFVLLEPALDQVDEGFDLGSFELLAQVEAGHFWFVTRNEMISWLVQRFAADAKRVLEVGCGTGFVLQGLRAVLPDAHIAGSELHSLGLTHARGRCAADVELFQMDARRGGLTGVLDLVGAFDVLEHIPEDGKVLADVFNSLRPGGHMIVSVPQHPWLWSTADDLAKHQRRYKVGEMTGKARAAGFTIRYQTSFVTLALPLMLASRLLARMKPEPRTLAEQTDAEFRLSPVANGLLKSVCRLEHGLRRAGLPLPVGGSSVIVAQKPL